VFRQYYGGILSEDKTEVYFMGIIDLLTTYSYKKMGEFFAKSLVHDSVNFDLGNAY
jgi:1-phosphatidylinositol-4-phosphate 5-kinase